MGGKFAVCIAAIFAAAVIALFFFQLPAGPAEKSAFEAKTGELGQFIDLAGDADFSGFSPDDAGPADIVEKRARNAKAFYLAGGKQIKWRVYQKPIHFFDGEKYVDLNLVSYPVIEKKEFVLNEKPRAARFRIGGYLLHRGVTAKINEANEIVFTDAKGSEIKKIVSGFAVDSEQNTATAAYEILQKQQKLEIFVNIGKEWLENAEYPIIIDPDTNYASSKADGYLQKRNGTYPLAVVSAPDSGISQLLVGQDYSDPWECPFFYSWNGSEFVYDTQLIYKLDSKEKEALQRGNISYLDTGGKIKGIIKEEEFETSYIDQVYLEIIDTKGGKTTKTVLKPAYSSRDLGLLLKSDNKYLIANHGDEVYIEFENAPALEQGVKREIKIAAKGYYARVGAH
ncbi:MAG: hypothetical protein PHH08_04315 [Candidatus ainarchaeum sp.]|nr:hypothetical protein [Candidatus ainarchaeum sp.]